jgi:hypothetical protein
VALLAEDLGNRILPSRAIGALCLAAVETVCLTAAAAAAALCLASGHHHGCPLPGYRRRISWGMDVACPLLPLFAWPPSQPFAWTPPSIPRFGEDCGARFEGEEKDLARAAGCGKAGHGGLLQEIRR